MARLTGLIRDWQGRLGDSLPLTSESPEAPEFDFSKVKSPVPTASAGPIPRAEPPAPSQAPVSHPRVKSVEVVVLSTMLADRAGIGEWGFSALVTVDGRRLLFDTGARPETVLNNARELEIDLSGVAEVVLSHHHGDHTGGLVTLRRSWRRGTRRHWQRHLSVRASS